MPSGLIKNKIIVLFSPCSVIHVFMMQLSILSCRSWVQFHPRSKWQTINMWYVIQYFDQGYWCHKGKFFCSATCFDTLAYAFPIIISILDHYPFEKDLQKLDLGGKHYHVKEKSSKKSFFIFQAEMVVSRLQVLSLN